MAKRLTTKDFIERTKKVHGDKYVYSITEYVANKVKVTITCPIHGNFNILPDNHIRNKQGCAKCHNEKNSKLHSWDVEKFIHKAKEVHGNKYNYSLVNYIDLKTKIKIICPKHGIFHQIPSDHIHKNSGCQKCAYIKCSKRLTNTTDDFIAKAQKKHKNKYGYSLVDYKSNKEKVKIICPIHGEFLQIPNSHVAGKGCPNCQLSKGEEKVKKFLENKNIQFKQQKRFNNCKIIKSLPFDFYLLNYDICIEYDGEQHFNPVKKFGGEIELENVQRRDKIKTEYCKNNNITLLRISYKDDVETILTNFFKIHDNI